MTHSYPITGVTCQNCIDKVTKLLTALPGVTAVSFSDDKQQVTVEMENHIDVSALNNALSGTKYQIPAMHTDDRMLSDTTPAATYKPIYIIFGYLLAITLLLQLVQDRFNLVQWMEHFMGGFFLVFSFFKMLDIPAFAMSYSSYDVVAKKWLGYGYIYPFIELALGLLFITGYEPLLTNWITLVVMGISTIGVIQSLLRKSKIKCACLGAAFTLPMSSVTLIEDLLMVMMSILMILMHY